MNSALRHARLPGIGLVLLGPLVGGVGVTVGGVTAVGVATAGGSYFLLWRRRT